MSYIIRIQIGESTAEYRYFIRSTNNILTLGTKPRGATLFSTQEEARRVANRELEGITYDIAEIE